MRQVPCTGPLPKCAPHMPGQNPRAVKPLETSPPSFLSEIPINLATAARKRAPHPSEWVEPKLVVEMPSSKDPSLVYHVTTETQG